MTIEDRLDVLLDAVLSSRRTAAGPARRLAELDAEQQRFTLHWVEVIARRNPELGYQFAAHAADAFDCMDADTVEAWIVTFMDLFDKSGMLAAAGVIRRVDDFAVQARERASGMALDDAVGILERFVQGLSGRQLRLESATEFYTDTETLYLPPMLSLFPERQTNFDLYKSLCTHFWAQTRFGTFRIPLGAALQGFPDADRARRLFHRLETVRLDARLAAELPGLHRQMAALATEAGMAPLPPHWQSWVPRLESATADANVSLEATRALYETPIPAALCYQGELLPERVEEVMAARLQREKKVFRSILAQLSPQPPEAEDGAAPPPPVFKLRRTPDPERPDQVQYTLELDGRPVAPPETLRSLLDSIVQDLGEIPPEYLVPAGDGGYSMDAPRPKEDDADGVWTGTYHEQGAFLYNEWDFDRRHYRKNWCTLRELPIHPGSPEFVPRTLKKYRGLVKNLRRTFEMLRGEEKVLKRQAYGDDVDIDALVEALADARSGMELTDRLFLRRRKLERDIAVMFMIDMSGSTKGWINDAERESLVLLCEALETLGDRYAIYGFTSLTRKRCELFHIKRFDEPYNEQVQARIAGITPRDYTRMGVVIRHLSGLLNQQLARTRLLLTLSDGKPDDYDGYRGRYGIEDTRQALLEARRDGVQAFCITIDKEAGEYLPQLYGPVNYTVVDDVRKLPLKVSDIYRKLTT